MDLASLEVLHFDLRMFDACFFSPAVSKEFKRIKNFLRNGNG